MFKKPKINAVRRAGKIRDYSQKKKIDEKI